MAGVSVHEAEIMMRQNEKAMRKSYSQMRDVAQKRIQRLGKDFAKTKSYQSHPEGFTKLKDLDKRDLAKAYSELSKFISAKGSTISGQRSIRQKTIRTWQEHGINLNERNYDKAIRILEELRRQKLVYGSDKVVELADTMLELDEDQTNEWLDNLETMITHTNELQKIDDVEGYDFDDVIRMIMEG